MKSNPAFLLLIPLFCPLAAASEVPAAPTVPPVITNTAASGTSYYRRAISGDFDGDLVRDVAQVHGNNAFVWFAPADFLAKTDLGISTLNDAVTLRGTGTGGRDQLAYTDSTTSGTTGLRVVSFSAGAWSTSVVSNSNWTNAVLVRDANPRGTSTTTKLIGVKSDGRTLILGATAANGWTPQSTVTPSTLASGVTITDIESIEWNGDGSPDIALATTQGAIIVDGSGTVLKTITGYTENVIAVLKETGATTDRLAVITTYSSPNSQVLAVFRSTSTAYDNMEQLMDLGGLGVCRAIAADEDGNGFDDLYLSNRMSEALTMLTNKRTTSTPAVESFGSDAYWYYECGSLSTSAPNNMATPAVADLDNDGDRDVFFTVQGSRLSYVIESNRALAGDTRPGITKIDRDASYNMTIRLTSPKNGTAPPTGATDVEVLMWYAAGTVTTSPELLAPTMPSTYTQSYSLTPFTGNQNITLAYANPTTASVYGVRMRYVTRVGSTTTAVWPATVGYLTSNDTQYSTILAYSPTPPSPEPGGVATSFGAQKSGGGFVPRPNIGPFPSGGTPH